MGLFRWLRGPKPPHDEAGLASGSAIGVAYLQGRLESLEKALGDAQGEIAKFRSLFGELQLEWASTLDKLNRWTARESARQRRRFERESAALGGDEQPEPTPAEHSGSSDVRLLTKDQLRGLVARGRLRPQNGG